MTRMLAGWAVEKLLEPDPREAKQAVWVREKLDLLRRALREQIDVADQAVSDTRPDESLAILDPLDSHGGIGLGRRPTVRFLPPGKGYVEVEVRPDGVHVRGEHDLFVAPKVSNSVVVYSRSTEEVFRR